MQPSDMSDRDLIACFALMGLAGGSRNTPQDATARWCYSLADAMLRVRHETPKYPALAPHPDDWEHDT